MTSRSSSNPHHHKRQRRSSPPLPPGSMGSCEDDATVAPKCSHPSSSPNENDNNSIKKSSSCCINEYSGFTLGDDDDDDANDITIPLSKIAPNKEKNNNNDGDNDNNTAKIVFDRFISQRRPFVLNYHPRFLQQRQQRKERQTTTTTTTTTTTKRLDNSNKRLQLSREMLHELIGHELVQVEKRQSSNDTFGKRRIDGDTQINMTFTDFLNGINQKKQEELWYLSPQDNNNNNERQQQAEEEEDDCRKPVISRLCQRLMKEGVIDESVGLAGHLILHSCHLWIGRSLKGSSSGLHHDVHDNFYLLLRGKKRFRLYDPSVACHVPTYGMIQRVFFNGRIVYKGDEDVGPDGVPLSVLMEREEEEEGVVLGKGFDYESDGEDEEAGAVFPPMDDNEDGEEDDFDCDDYDDEDDENNEPTSSSNDDNDNDNDSNHPGKHFSPIPPHLLNNDNRRQLSERYPTFVKHCYDGRHSTVVEVKAGQMLYLPAGWFHEVTSYDDVDDEEWETKKDGDGSSNGKDVLEKGSRQREWKGCHVALNYWYHPPDKLDDFDCPYRNVTFWKG